MAVNTWVAAGAGNWGDDANWSLGHVPTATETATFDNTSDNNCAINVAPNVLGINLATGYDGTATWGAVNSTVGTEGILQAAGTATYAPAQTVTCAGPFTHSAGTFTTNRLYIIMTGEGTSFSAVGGQGLIGLRASANVNIASTNAFRILITDAGKIIKIANTKTLNHYYYDGAAYSLSNLGGIAGPGTYKVILYDADKTIRFGQITAPLIVAASSAATGNRKLTALEDASIVGAVTVSSDHASSTMTLDFAGRNSYLGGAVTIGTRGIVLWGEGVHHFRGSAFNSSAGVSTPETSQMVFTKAVTITMAAGGAFYDLISYAEPITLGSDVAVTNIFAHVGPIVKGAFALNMTDAQKEYTGMRRPLRRSLSSAILMPPCCRPLLDGIERSV